MKIAVYTICKNEERFTQRWLDSCKDADYIVVSDTGSTDETKPNFINQTREVLNKLRFVSCHVLPWRFDDARNFSLNLIPDDVDICICLDLDEVLLPGWRKTLEEEFIKNPQTTRFRYNYIWSWNEDGSPGLTYYADKIHVRNGYRWKGPVHETLIKDPRTGPEVQTFIQKTLIEHHPDNSKPRSQYLPLLEVATKEDPHNDRMAHYYGRELFFWGQYEEALQELNRHLKLPSAKWDQERAASYRYIGDCYWALENYPQAVNSFLRAYVEAPARENCVKLAQAYRALGNWRLCKDYSEAALEFTDRPNSYINDQTAWSDWPKQMLEEAEKNLSSPAILLSK